VVEQSAHYSKDEGLSLAAAVDTRSEAIYSDVKLKLSPQILYYAERTRLKQFKFFVRVNE
jgi:hypothetical protein